jgi:hypothetical protein
MCSGCCTTIDYLNKKRHRQWWYFIEDTILSLSHPGALSVSYPPVSTVDAAQNAILVNRLQFQDFDSLMHMYLTSKRSQKSEAAVLQWRQLSAVTGRGGGWGRGGAGRGGCGWGDPKAQQRGLVSKAKINKKVTTVKNKRITPKKCSSVCRNSPASASRLDRGRCYWTLADACSLPKLFPFFLLSLKIGQISCFGKSLAFQPPKHILFLPGGTK